MIRSNLLRQLVPDSGLAAEAFHAVDWARTPIGPPEGWPAALKTMVSVLFRARHPMLLWWGPEFVQFYNDGYLPSLGDGQHPQAMGQRVADCWPERWGRQEAMVRRVLQGAESTWFEDRPVQMRRHGVLEDVYWTYGHSPVRNDDGTDGGVLVVCSETTRRVVLERRLQSSEESLRSFIMQAPVAMGILEGPQHIFTLLNPEFMRLLFGGRRAEELLGKSVRQALPEIEAQGYEQVLDYTFNTGKPFVGRKMHARLLQADGQPKDMFVNFAYEAIRDGTGKITGVLAVVFEVTDEVNEEKEIRSLAENLRTAIVSRDTFLGIASHELKTPLTSMKLQNQFNLRVLKKRGMEGFNAESLRKLFESADAQTDRLARLVEDMLDVYRLNAGQLRMTFATFNFSRALQVIGDRFAPQFEAAGGSLETSLQADVLVDADEFRLEQVVTNLFTNALKYAPGAVVRLTLTQDAAATVFSVHDGGPGIAPEQREVVFERFARVGPADGIAGLGLGLYICREIVLAHGGRIRVESPPGAGTTFVVTLPRSR